ncbi:recombination-associated protein RdgC [Geomesophilobacter sediminis]|uniref:Recombination-associated protein RdgC n=1 Tax=Geomesophilobacter sediminis TaxID=2798584 RepID=A0A8J7M1F5_9BACT|nr:recombination-associated protein RdgC [Geomesophilobacter sediminis]MBJ6726882.1 recombination-associated protein RdgC [Geomesophilobacter sediminis]
MGILANTVSICHFQVQGELPAKEELYSWTLNRLAGNRFNPIDQGSEELSVGWVHLDDPRSSEFDTPAACWRDHYLMFTLRRDRRAVPSAILKAHLDREYERWLGENPGYAKVPKQEKETLKEAVHATLLSQTLPTPSTYDAVWDTQTGMLTFSSLSPKVIELFEEEFKKTFEGLRLSAFHPYARAESVLDESNRALLAQANRSKSDNFLELIKENQWLGVDFMLWLMYQTMNDSSEYSINQQGILSDGERFVAYVDDRVVLLGAGENGAQKITVAGPQDHFNEVRSALLNRKQITEATLHLETSEDEHWKMTLKGELFHFASFKSPAVKLEKDSTTDEAMEREAVFFERMVLLEKGTQLFNSLFATFLKLRLGQGWGEHEGQINKWLNVCSNCNSPLV